VLNSAADRLHDFYRAFPPREPSRFDGKNMPQQILRTARVLVDLFAAVDAHDRSNVAELKVCLTSLASLLTSRLVVQEPEERHNPT